MSSRVGVIGITREIVMLIPSLRLEGEAQLGQHWGKQSHQELNALATTRWITFPWDEYVLTTAGFGFGLSYAFVPAPLEARPGRTPDQLLIYLLLDLEFALPRSPDHIIFFRIHHRSDGYGAIGDARATNFLGLGVRARF